MKHNIKQGFQRSKAIECRAYSDEKIFCVGRNKTGTTSINRALNDLGYLVAPQKPAEMLIEQWAKRDFRALTRFCCQYDAFQDVPFSYPYTYQQMDQAFPNAKFILTIRDSADEWYRSVTRYHARDVGCNGVPTAEDVKRHPYRYKGYAWDCQRLLYGISEYQAYDPDIYKAHYESHNSAIIDYFRWKPEKLLILNVKEENAFWKLGKFLGKPVAKGAEFPWENRT